MAVSTTASTLRQVTRLLTWQLLVKSFPAHKGLKAHKVHRPQSKAHKVSKAIKELRVSKAIRGIKAPKALLARKAHRVSKAPKVSKEHKATKVTQLAFKEHKAQLDTLAAQPILLPRLARLQLEIL